MRRIIYTLWFCLYSLSGYCQIPKAALLKLTARADSASRNFAAEKLYLQFDRPYYALGDTIWLKAWLFNSPTLLLSAKSGLLHIDIANDSNKVIKQYLLPVQAGMSWGNIVLDDKTYKTGTYILRAYTNWMRNFGGDYFFYKPFYVSGAGESNLLADAKFSSTIVNGSNTANAKLIFGTMDQKPFAVEPMQLQVMAGSRQLYKQKLQTGIDGTLDVNFKIPLKAVNLAIIAESEKKDKRAVIPVVLNRPENTDLQFLPEGGSLVAGVGTRVGFKAISEDGKGADISGVITDQDGQQTAAFQSIHNGMGSFDLLPEPGKIYTAKIKLPDGSIKPYPLPAVKPFGTVLHVMNNIESDSVTVTFSATDDLMRLHSNYFLIGKARGVVCYAGVVSFKNSSHITKAIAKSLFPTGIMHFIVTTTDGKPVNERLIFIDHHDNLQIEVEPDQQVYEPRDSVAVHLKVRDHAGNPVAGNFTVAVTDDAQVKNDTANDENIVTRMLLTSDLKGYVEAPGYYLQPKNNAALDVLLLTQGWVSYDPVDLTPKFEPEKEFVVKGNVKNVFGKPIKGTKVLLFSKSPVILMDTLTDKQGRFTFDQFPRVDTPIFILQAVNKSGKSFNVNLNVDETGSPVFSPPKMPQVAPWYVNSDSTLLNFTHNNAQAQQLQYNPQGGHILREVKISANKIVKGSENLNGPGNADLVLDEKDLEASGKKTLMQLFEQNIKGFREVQVQTHMWYYIYEKPIYLIVNGVRIDQLYNAFDFEQYIKFYNAEEVKGLEIISSAKYSAAYEQRYFPGEFPLDKYAFVELTTRSGGVRMDQTAGVYLYKPLAMSYPHQFYKPKYSIKNSDKHPPDLRATILWEPNVITNDNGEAMITFYTADKPSTYTIIVEGTDMNGNLGYKTARVIIGKKTKDKAK